MDSGSKLLLLFILPMISMATWLWACETEVPRAQTATWRLEGTVGGKHPLSLTLNITGEALSGEARNTLGEPRTLEGSLNDGQAFLFHEKRGAEITGTFEGRVLENGDLRGIWSAAGDERWFPFYLHTANAGQPQQARAEATPAAGGDTPGS